VKADTVFLTVNEVLGLHSDQIREFGGAAGIRDQGLLESAVAQASTTYDGKYLHNSLFAQPYLIGKNTSVIASCSGTSG